MLLRRLLLAPLLLLSALSLADCGTPQTVLAPRANIPAALLTCMGEPTPPDTLAADTDLTDWMLATISAGADCRTKLGAVKQALGQ